jgi:hypothetical protein
LGSQLELPGGFLDKTNEEGAAQKKRLGQPGTNCAASGLILIRLRCQGEGENKSEKSTIKPKRLAGPHHQQKRHVIQIEKSKKNNNSNNNQTARQRAFSVHTAIAIARFFIFGFRFSLV